MSLASPSLRRVGCDMHVSFVFFTVFIVSYTKLFAPSSFVCCNDSLFLFSLHFHLRSTSLGTFVLFYDFLQHKSLNLAFVLLAFSRHNHIMEYLIFLFK